MRIGGCQADQFKCGNKHDDKQKLTNSEMPRKNSKQSRWYKSMYLDTSFSYFRRPLLLYIKFEVFDLVGVERTDSRAGSNLRRILELVSIIEMNQAFYRGDSMKKCARKLLF